MSGRGKQTTAAGFPMPVREPQRTEVPEHEADRFVGGKAARKPRGERIAMYLDPDLAERFRIACVKRRCSLSDGVAEAIKEWLMIERG